MTDKIVKKQLADLGFETNEPAPIAPVPEPYVPSDRINKKPNPRIKRRDPDLFDMPDIPPFLDRRKTKIEPDTRAKDWKPTPVVQSAYCKALTERLNEVRLRIQENKGSPDAVIEPSDLDIIVNNLHEQLGNMMEHAGFIYQTGEASQRMKSFLRTFLLSNCKVYNGSMYRYPLEKGANNGR
ncbi:MAG: hypothetical protein VX352_01755 [Actinomycetota bacterium]